MGNAVIRTVPLILIRHGQTEFNLAERLQGSLDSPLTPKGIEQAHLIGKNISKYCEIEQFNFVSSPQNRALTTTKIIQSYFSPPFKFEIDANLHEVSFGEWEGKTLEELPDFGYDLALTKRLNWAKFCKTGESFEAALTRAKSALAKYNTAANVLISHGALISIIRGINLGLSMDDMMKIPIEQNCYWVLENGEEIEISLR